jgi:hypothetical protein
LINSRLPSIHLKIYTGYKASDYPHRRKGKGSLNVFLSKKDKTLVKVDSMISGYDGLLPKKDKRNSSNRYYF